MRTTITIVMSMSTLLGVVGLGCGSKKDFSCSDDSECHTGYSCTSQGECVQGKTPAMDAGMDAKPTPPPDSGPSCSTAGFNLALTTCSPCLLNSCCAEVGACNSNAGCKSYVSCIAPCTTGACYDACKSTYAEGYSLFQTIGTCAVNSCKNECIPKKGIGDGCKDDSDCVSGATCTEHNSGTTGWCTKPCSGNSGTSCPGLHNGYNENGELNWCVNTSQGYYCFPGCDDSNAACSEFGSATCQGTYTYNNTSVRVCSY